MASASSLAQFNSASSGEGFETIEIDPQYAQGLGFSQGDVVCFDHSHSFKLCLSCAQVEIGLLHDMPIAKSVGTEPLTSDDWEIIVRPFKGVFIRTILSSIYSRKSMLLMSNLRCFRRYAWLK